MRRWWRFIAFFIASAAIISGSPNQVAAEGEPDGSFPSWEERWFLQLHNRARCDPQYEMDVCGSACAEAACYSPAKPLTWTVELNRAARFHSANLTDSGCGMKHNSPCTLVSNIDSLYPDSCDGATSCACVPSTENCSPTGGTTWPVRIGLFGTTGSGENIANSNPDPNVPFYQWLFEPTANSSCGFRSDNGHRYNILSELSYINSVGIGMAGNYTTADFGPGPAAGKIPSGSHYPRQAASVEIWTNWYDSQGPSVAAVNVEGVCHTMSLERGTSTNGAWMATVSGVGSGCHRYYFEFRDSEDTPATYPTTGSLAIGSGGGCPDWDIARPTSCLVRGEGIFSDGFETGSTNRWSSSEP
jgi:uncharacterized protein YkwD